MKNVPIDWVGTNDAVDIGMQSKPGALTYECLAVCGSPEEGCPQVKVDEHHFRIGIERSNS